MSPIARVAIRRLLAVWPVHEQVVPGSVRHADLTTSTCDARVALTIALGEQADIDGYPVDAA